MLLGTSLFLLTLSAGDMVMIPQGQYRPLYLTKDSPQQQVDAFLIDKKSVSNQQFYDFTQANPKWQKQDIPALFAEAQYLQQWQYQQGSWSPKEETLNQPVSNVSWFAAQAYCHAMGKRLPKVNEWERAANASESQMDGNTEPAYRQKILDWYSRPNSGELADIAQGPANYWGIYDLHGLIWEWTEDFNSALVTGESRGDSSIDQKLFCAAGASGAADPSDYAAFMRFGFRSSLKAKYTLANLGFRCANDVKKGEN
jgi:formylglycine-generating enzyme